MRVLLNKIEGIQEAIEAMFFLNVLGMKNYIISFQKLATELLTITDL